jgi:hypothetical protein
VDGEEYGWMLFVGDDDDDDDGASIVVDLWRESLPYGDSLYY